MHELEVARQLFGLQTEVMNRPPQKLQPRDGALQRIDRALHRGGGGVYLVSDSSDQLA